MANKEISALPTVGIPLAGTEQFHVRDGSGNSREVNLAEVAEYAGRGPQASAIGRARFSPITAADWSVDNGGTPNANAYQGDGTWLIEHVGPQSVSWAHVVIDGSNDFDVVFAVAPQITTDSFAGFGFFVADGNAAVGLQINYNDDYVEQTWTIPSTFGSNVATTAVVGQTNNFPLGLFDVMYGRITLVGTALSFYVSANGLDWDLIHTALDTDNGMVTIDKVGVYLQSDSVTAGVTTRCRILGYDATGPQTQLLTGGGTLPVAFKGFRGDRDGTTTQAIPATTETTLIGDREVYDTDSGYDPLTGIFTVPSSLDGKYMNFIGAIETDASEDITLIIRETGGTSGQAVRQTSSAADSVSRNQVETGPVQVTAGETWELKIFVATAANVVAQESSFFCGYVLESAEDVFEYLEDTGTGRTATAADFKGNRTLELTNAAAITLTVNTGLNPAGPLTVIQGGAGAITVAGTATIESAGGLLSSGGQHTAFTLIPTNTTDVYKLIGTLA